MTPFGAIYSFSRSWGDSGEPGRRCSKKPWRAAKSSAAASWSNSSALPGSAGKAPAEAGLDDPDRSGGSARMISASRRITRARFSSGVSVSPVSAAGAPSTPSAAGESAAGSVAG